jgi:molybdopterin-containing oxidoreductase family iron-sulfur binding subunit
MQLNPDLSVRDKGVMEKCTFCIQRIRTGKDKAQREGRKVQDGDIQTACAQTCPTSAIVFGDLLKMYNPASGNADSKTAKMWRKHQVELGKTKQNKQTPDLRGYRILESLNTDPCVMYLERVRDV